MPQHTPPAVSCPKNNTSCHILTRGEITFNNKLINLVPGTLWCSYQVIGNDTAEVGVNQAPVLEPFVTVALKGALVVIL